jgi:hypothetical protein
VAILSSVTKGEEGKLLVLGTFITLEEHFIRFCSTGFEGRSAV